MLRRLDATGKLPLPERGPGLTEGKVSNAAHHSSRETDRRVSEPSVRLFVETPSGTFIRSVRPATVLPKQSPIGDAAEDATRRAAAYWGLPDFVFRSKQLARGAATREVGDAIVVVGPMAVSVQVKARQVLGTDETRERLWLDKRIRQATRQAHGTIKSIAADTGLLLTNERGREIRINGRERTWLGVVVLDHPGVADYVPATGAVVLLRRDWEFLFEQLKSTYAVMEYLRRISTDDPIALGLEPVRYYQLAAADASTKPAPVDSRLAHLGPGWSAPLLPQAPAGHSDIRHFSVLRAVLEDIALTRLPSEMAASDIIDVLAAIDAAPIAHREAFGKTWVSWLKEVADAPAGEIAWQFRSLIGDDRPYLIFAAATRHDAVVQEAFGWLISLRHEQHLELVPERKSLMTVGILLTPRQDRSRPWDTTMVATQQRDRLSSEDRARAEGFWGKFGESRIKA